MWRILRWGGRINIQGMEVWVEGGCPHGGLWKGWWVDVKKEQAGLCFSERSMKLTFPIKRPLSVFSAAEIESRRTPVRILIVSLKIKLRYKSCFMIFTVVSCQFGLRFALQVDCSGMILLFWAFLHFLIMLWAFHSLFGHLPVLE